MTLVERRHHRLATVPPEVAALSRVSGSIDSRLASCSKSAPSRICTSSDSALARATARAAGDAVVGITICRNVTDGGRLGSCSWPSRLVRLGDVRVADGDVIIFPSRCSLATYRCCSARRRACSVSQRRYSSWLPNPLPRSAFRNSWSFESASDLLHLLIDGVRQIGIGDRDAVSVWARSTSSSSSTRSETICRDERDLPGGVFGEGGPRRPPLVDHFLTSLHRIGVLPTTATMRSSGFRPRPAAPAAPAATRRTAARSGEMRGVSSLTDYP